MSSKKTSQAQPSQPSLGESAEVTCRNAEPGAKNAERGAKNAEPGGQAEMLFDCPVWPPALPEVAAELQELLRSGEWARYQGEPLQRLCDRIRRYTGAAHVRLTCSGSAAMELALRACGVGAPPAHGGDAQRSETGKPPQEVICPVLDYPGNVRAVRLLGACPVLVDSPPGRWTIDPDAVLAAATEQTVAVIASHLYGEVAEVQTLREICEARGFILIEDVCQMPGGSLNGRPLGSFGHVATWSFGGSKPLTAGCGGAITSGNDRIAQRLAAYVDRPSDAFPLSPLQAAVLIPQWSALDQSAQRQRAAVKQLTDACRPLTPRWRWPSDSAEDRQGIFYKLPILTESLPWHAGPVAAAASSARIGTTAIVSAALQCGVPAGQPFRIPEQMARSRGRIASSANASAIAASMWLVDHRALIGDGASLDRLARVLVNLYRRVMEQG